MKLLTISTDTGPIFVEFDDTSDLNDLGPVSSELVAKGPLEDLQNFAGQVSVPFESAMGGLRSFVISMRKMIEGLDVSPSEVKIDLGLRAAGSVGFIIAKAGADTSINVSIKWTPKA